mgnify:CR=1 FL=1|tara:strand:+ start:1291 stop:2157 length:867 start_codon:yes stop_codon:yes gene_type:complete
MSESTVVREDDSFVDAHGVRIHYYRWRAAQPKAVVQLVHGLGEYAARYEGFAQALAAAGYTVYANDHRGHGQTGLEQWADQPSRFGKPGPGGLGATIAVVREFTALIRDREPGLPLVYLGHSLGSLFGQRILQSHAVDYDAVVFSGTAYRTLRHMNSGDLNKRHAHLGPTTAEWLSRDRAVVDAFAADPLTFEAKAAELYGLLDGLKLLGTPAKLAKDLPMLILNGEEDSLGNPESVTKLARAYREKGGLSDVTLKIYAGARHEVYNEVNRDEVIADLIAWLDAHLGG